MIDCINLQSAGVRKLSIASTAAALPGTGFQTGQHGGSIYKSRYPPISSRLKIVFDIFRNCRHVEYVSNGKIKKTEENHARRNQIVHHEIVLRKMTRIYNHKTGFVHAAASYNGSVVRALF